MNKDFKLFTPGPVMMHDFTLAEGVRQLSYFRTEEFSEIILECQSEILDIVDAGEGYRVIIITGSGTAAMEASVTSLFSYNDRLLVVNGGTFGERFSEICKQHSLQFDEVSVEFGRQLGRDVLESFSLRSYSGVLVNHHETSTGNLYDLNILSEFCMSTGALLVVDAIGSFLADPLSMLDQGIDALIFSSQKGLALPPGLSFVVLSPRAVEVVMSGRSSLYYLDLKRYLQDLKRGQTPFTPAVGTIYQLVGMLRHIRDKGQAAIIESTHRLAVDFREMISSLPFEIFAEAPSNALTALRPTNGLRPEYFVRRLKNEFGIFVAPNGGVLANKIFRVGHLGNLTEEDHRQLVAALAAII